MKTPLLVLLALSVPIAVGVRLWKSAPVEDEHSHGGDPRAADALAAKSGAARTDALRSYLADPNPLRRLAAAEALDAVPADERAPLVEAALTDSDARVRVEAVHGLMQGDSEALAPLRRAALYDEDAWVRETAAQELSQHAADALTPFVPDLVARLDDAAPTTRWFAVNALSKAAGKPWRYSGRAMGTREAEAVERRWKAWGRGQKSGQPAPEPRLPERTEPCPDTVIRTIDGRTIAPARDGQVTLVNFWGTWCEPCRTEIPDLQAMHDGYAERGVRVVGVALSEPNGAAGLKAWCAKHGVAYPQALADDATLAAFGDIHEVPQTLLIDGRGRIRYHWHGARDRQTLLRAIERVLKS